MSARNNLKAFTKRSAVPTSNARHPLAFATAVSKRGSKTQIMKQGNEKDAAVSYTPITISISDGLGVAFNGAEHELVAKLDKGGFHHLQNCALEFEIVCGGTGGTDWADLIPAPYFLSTIKFRTSNGTDIQVRSDFGNYLTYATLSDEVREDYGSVANFSKSWGGRSMRGDGSRILSGQTKIFCLPFRYLFTENFASGFPMSECDPESMPYMILTMAKQIYSDRYASTSTLTLSAVRLTFNQAKSTAYTAASVKNLILNTQLVSSYLSEIDCSLSSQSLTCGTETKIELGALKNRRIAFIALQIRESGNDANYNGLTKGLPLGSGGILDIKSATGSSLFGSPQRVELLESVLLQTSLPSALSKSLNAYVLSFAPNVKRALEGSMEGYMDFDSNSNYLSITPSSLTGTNEVQTLTPSGTVASGGMRLEFAGETSGILAYNANAAALLAAFRNMDVVRSWPGGIEAIFSGVLSSAATVTFVNSTYFSYSGCQTYPFIHVISEGAATTAPANVYWTTTRTTVGNLGFTTGTYDVEVLGFAYNRVSLADRSMDVLNMYQGGSN